METKRPKRPIRPVATVKTRRAMFNSRTCYVCRQSIPEAQGVYHADLGVLTHQGRCSDHASVCRRTTDRSARGRFRTKGETLRLIERGWGSKVATSTRETAAMP